MKITKSQGMRIRDIDRLMEAEDADSRFISMLEGYTGLRHVEAVGILIIADGPDGNSLHSVYDDDEAGVYEYADEPDYSE